MKKSPIQVLHFALHDEFIDLHNLLKVTGVADSGASGKALVATGSVTVDSVQELRKSAKIRAGQLVKLPGVSIHVHQSDTPRPPKPEKPAKVHRPKSMPAAQAIMATPFPGMEPAAKPRARPRARTALDTVPSGKMVTAKRPSKKPTLRSKHHT
jgi:ribosome-associated protein